MVVKMNTLDAIVRMYNDNCLLIDRDCCWHYVTVICKIARVYEENKTVFILTFSFALHLRLISR